MTHILPDVLAKGLRVVFCGTAASATSAEKRAYYAGQSNAFWGTLYRIGLIPHPLQPTDFREVLNYKFGLTDVAKTVSGNDNELQTSDFDAKGLIRKIEQYHPQVLAFTSKRAGQAVLNSKVKYGWQAETIGQTRLYVLPSPSGAARRYWDESIWRELAKDINRQDAKNTKLKRVGQ